MKEIPFSRWHAAIARRRSRRMFDPRPVDTGLLESIGKTCREIPKNGNC
ncbi:MAG: hypothetical protein ACOY4I_15440 [Bacillota bacterium]